ncbi:high choriolytic enzyme 1-like isoform X1 [Hoplias malabaricus]|uniref:high choriolytic enzyme 1-like isoform X1 n=1 Tax=Hoplias malabaricus TaxID=27720 RepID=UPI003462896E
MRTSIMHLTLTLILLLQLGFSPAQSRYIKYEKLQATHKQSLDKQDISYREDDYSVSGLIERANRNSDIREDEVFVSDLIERANTNIGRQGRKQILSLKRHGCIHKGVIQHEFLHALGLRHEQSSSDRDEHVKILYENIQPEHKHNFDIKNTNNLDTPYDYGSVMQYGR